MKTIILFILLVSANFAQHPLINGLFDSGVSYETETLTYQTRVEADGGEVMDLDAVNDFYLDAKANNYLDTLICALLYTGGVKIGTDSLFKWYDLTSNENDFNAGLNEIAINLSPDYSATNGIGGGGGGIPVMFCPLTYNQPTAYYSIVKRTNVDGYSYFWGAVTNQALLQDGATDKLYLYAGGDFVSNAVYTNDTFEFYRIIYSGATSSAQINNGTVYTGNPGTNNLSAVLFTIINAEPNTYFKCFIISPRLSTAKDLALKNILNTIYPTY